jgi:nucleoside-diphosphate-sugar epimerase
MSKPPPSNWLVLGGCGFIGRNFIKYLLDNGLAGELRVCDKKHPLQSALGADHKAALLDERVEFVPCDLSQDDFVGQAFSTSRGGGAWDFCINLAAETTFGKKDKEFYAKGVEAASKCAAAAAAVGVKKFIQVSHAAVYKGDKYGEAGADEAAPVAPWHEVAEYCSRAEAAARGGAGAMPVVVLRPAQVYGPGDTAGLMTRAVVASTFKAEKAKCEFLWDGALKLSTVHVFDVARAIYFASRKGAPGAVYNLADKGNTDQARVAAALTAVLGVETSFKGSMMSSAAVMALGLEKIAATVNHNLMIDWMALRAAHKIDNTPLSPFLHPSLLDKTHFHINGAGIEGAPAGPAFLLPPPHLVAVTHAPPSDSHSPSLPFHAHASNTSCSDWIQVPCA